jgi:hypothetical protein
MRRLIEVLLSCCDRYVEFRPHYRTGQQVVEAWRCINRVR